MGNPLRLWRRFLWRWFVLFLIAGVVFAVIFAVSKVVLQPLLAVAAQRYRFALAQDFIDWVNSLGPIGIALAGSALLLRVTASWPRRAKPSSSDDESASGTGPVALSPRKLTSLSRWFWMWTAVVVLFVVLPSVAIYEQLPVAGGLTLDAIACFLFGATLMVVAAGHLAPMVERLGAATIGTLWRWRAVDLRDQWRSTYHYRSDGEEKTGVQLMLITQIGRLAYARNIGGTSPHRHVIRMTISGDYVTGEWRNTVRGARHHGVFQLRVKANGQQMVGRWVGFDSQANIQDGSWTWDRL